MKPFLCLIFFCVFSSAFILYTGGNSWDVGGQISSLGVTNNGYAWNKLPTKFNTYFYSGSAIPFTLSMVVKSNYTIRATINLGSQ